MIEEGYSAAGKFGLDLYSACTGAVIKTDKAFVVHVDEPAGSGVVEKVRYAAVVAHEGRAACTGVVEKAHCASVVGECHIVSSRGVVPEANLPAGGHEVLRCA